MEKNIQKKINDYTEEFKTNLQKWLESNQVTIFVNDTNKTSDFIQYMNDFPNLELAKQDFQKRKRIKNNVPDYNRCIALKCNGERCSRKQKNNETCFCGTHMKGSPYGTIEKDNLAPKKKKIQLWLEEINGISRYIDNEFNVYSSEDIVNANPSPRIIGKYGFDNVSGTYHMIST